MKIDKVIMGCDENSFYLDFWEIVSKVWKIKFNIEPVLILISNKKLKVSEKFGKVIRVAPIKGIPTYLQAQWARFYFTKSEPDTTWIISDLDMIPLSKDYFCNSIKHVSDDCYVHLNPQDNNFPVCYNVAKGRIFEEVFDFKNSWKDSVYNLFKLNLGMNHVNNPILCGKANWGAEEEYITFKIKLFARDKKRIFFYKREGGINGRRIDRESWDYSKRLIAKNYYFDCHCPRPYKENKKEIDGIVNLALSEESKAL